MNDSICYSAYSRHKNDLSADVKKCCIQKCKLLVYVVGIDKLTETSQVSEDGATLLLQQGDSTHSQSEHSSETQVRDTEPTSGEDDKVQHHR